MLGVITLFLFSLSFFGLAIYTAMAGFIFYEGGMDSIGYSFLFTFLAGSLVGFVGFFVSFYDWVKERVKRKEKTDGR